MDATPAAEGAALHATPSRPLQGDGTASRDGQRALDGGNKILDRLLDYACALRRIEGARDRWHQAYARSVGTQSMDGLVGVVDESRRLATSPALTVLAGVSESSPLPEGVGTAVNTDVDVGENAAAKPRNEWSSVRLTSSDSSSVTSPRRHNSLLDAAAPAAPDSVGSSQTATALTVRHKRDAPQRPSPPLYELSSNSESAIHPGNQCLANQLWGRQLSLHAAELLRRLLRRERDHRKTILLREIEARYAVRLYEASDAAQRGLDFFAKAQDDVSTSRSSTFALPVDSTRRAATLSPPVAPTLHPLGGAETPKFEKSTSSKTEGRAVRRGTSSASSTEPSSSGTGGGSVRIPRRGERSSLNDGVGDAQRGTPHVTTPQPSSSPSSSCTDASSSVVFARPTQPQSLNKTKTTAERSDAPVAEEAGLVTSVKSSGDWEESAGQPPSSGDRNAPAPSEAVHTTSTTPAQTLQQPRVPSGAADSAVTHLGESAEGHDSKDVHADGSVAGRRVEGTRVKSFHALSDGSSSADRSAQAGSSATSRSGSVVLGVPSQLPAVSAEALPHTASSSSASSSLPAFSVVPASPLFGQCSEMDSKDGAGDRTRVSQQSAAAGTHNQDITASITDIGLPAHRVRGSSFSDLWTLDKDESEEDDEALDVGRVRNDGTSSLPPTPSFPPQPAPDTGVGRDSESSTTSSEAFTVQLSGKKLQEGDGGRLDERRRSSSDKGEDRTAAPLQAGTSACAPPRVARPDSVRSTSGLPSKHSCNLSGASEVEPRPAIVFLHTDTDTEAWARVQSECDDEPQPSLSAPQPSEPSPSPSPLTQRLSAWETATTGEALQPAASLSPPQALPYEDEGHPPPPPPDQNPPASAEPSRASSFYFSLPAQSMPRAFSSGGLPHGLSSQELAESAHAKKDAVSPLHEGGKAKRPKSATKDKPHALSNSGSNSSNDDTTPYHREAQFAEEPHPFAHRPSSFRDTQRDVDEETSTFFDSAEEEESTTFTGLPSRQRDQRRQQQQPGVSWTIPLDWADSGRRQKVHADPDNVTNPRPSRTPAAADASATPSPSHLPSPHRSHHHRTLPRHRLPPHLQANRPRARVLTRGLRPVFFSSSSGSSSGTAGNDDNNSSDFHTGSNAFDAASLLSQVPRPAGPWYAAPAPRLKRHHVARSGATRKARPSRSWRQKRPPPQQQRETARSSGDDDDDDDMVGEGGRHRDVEVSPVRRTAVQGGSASVQTPAGYAQQQQASARVRGGPYAVPAGLATTPSPARPFSTPAPSALHRSTTTEANAPSRSPQHRPQPAGPTYAELHERRQAYEAQHQQQQRRVSPSTGHRASYAQIQGHPADVPAATTEATSEESPPAQAGTAAAAVGDTVSKAVVWRLTGAPLPRSAASQRVKEDSLASAPTPTMWPPPPAPSSVAATPSRPAEVERAPSLLPLAESATDSLSSSPRHGATATAPRGAKSRPPTDVVGEDKAEAEGTDLRVEEARRRLMDDVRTSSPPPPVSPVVGDEENVRLQSGVINAVPQPFRDNATFNATEAASMSTSPGSAHAGATGDEAGKPMNAPTPAVPIPAETNTPSPETTPPLPLPPLSPTQSLPRPALNIQEAAEGGKEGEGRRRSKNSEAPTAASEAMEYTMGLTNSMLYGRASTAAEWSRSTSHSTTPVLRHQQTTHQPSVAATRGETPADEGRTREHDESTKEGSEEEGTDDIHDTPVHPRVEAEKKKEEEGLADALQDTPRASTPFAPTVAPGSPGPPPPVSREASGLTHPEKESTGNTTAESLAQPRETKEAEDVATSPPSHSITTPEKEAVEEDEKRKELHEAMEQPPLDAETLSPTPVEGVSGTPSFTSHPMLSLPTLHAYESALAATTTTITAPTAPAAEARIGKETGSALGAEPSAAAKAPLPSPEAPTSLPTEPARADGPQQPPSPQQGGAHAAFVGVDSTLGPRNKVEGSVSDRVTATGNTVSTALPGHVIDDSQQTPASRQQDERVEDDRRLPSMHVGPTPYPAAAARGQPPESPPPFWEDVREPQHGTPTGEQSQEQQLSALAQRRAELERRLVDLEAQLRHRQENALQSSAPDYFESDDVAFHSATGRLGVRPGRPPSFSRANTAAVSRNSRGGRGSGVWGRGGSSGRGGVCGGGRNNSAGATQREPEQQQQQHLHRSPAASPSPRSAIQWTPRPHPTRDPAAASGAESDSTAHGRVSHAAVGTTGDVRGGRSIGQPPSSSLPPDARTAPSAPAVAAPSTSTIRPRLSASPAAATAVVAAAVRSDEHPYSRTEHRGYGFANAGSVGSPAGPNYRRTTTAFLISADWRYQRTYVDTVFFPQVVEGARSSHGASKVPQPAEDGETPQQPRSSSSQSVPPGERHGGADVFACRPFRFP
ncbi:hypothetical protein ABB37_07109 [Leptomonas pyrrhocoris]|uniref:Uncharacterized protein n=1 Tax=Leptomonas pyrrhocoris TaxID=157538 RepID=A0A0N0VE30_LEPPY|nr:hypothetical protein ABB37_07109 [Leptomonas pyrrhocoris]KPA77194.1 hypothetical protein ABB37_07109 [Leptomonas pyrrhocoris]|eukprot:XP_015655633.1 hypothetical protein ABB37_07109 [Leptomonas pyrrhocoris]